ncbi:SWIM zinc finger family protein [Leptospira alstonii]|uniref:SWIM-type domain-containing protein n=2 Tax=Leptospira alstonii TaxID=28452 RepID=M6CWJ2_9LEPT|nr:hypothetical protein [Leptospira alstonii]EMJ96287.1 hypothetical protein LEP1GSC194_3780 [Leptospira alstonii serovar Sichuan str. 79601]EQA79008.1 hypothetical protein LEP1GSC193_0234 [Leptospira alstonii serovar Pingchang str. 80-412]
MTNLKKARETLSKTVGYAPSDTIVERGMKLFDAGAVYDLVETKSNCFYAKVFGNTSDYELRIENIKSKKAKVICDCPYDMDIYCKHGVAAVLQIALSDSAHPKKKGKKQPGLSEILSKVTHKDLVEFLLEKADADPDFYSELIHFFSKSDSNSKTSYLETAMRIFRSISGGTGFIDYRSSFKFEREMNRFLDKAERLYSVKPKEALYIAWACAETVFRAALQMDDSAGITGGLISDTFDIIEKSIRKNPELADEIFEVCLHLYRNETAQDFGFSSEYFNILISLDLDSKQQKLLQEVLEQELNRAQKNPYRIEGIAVQIYKLFQKSGQTSEGMDFLNPYIQHPEIRKIFLDQVVSKKQFLHAEKLILDGIQIAEKLRHSGTVTEWKKELLKLMERQGNTKSVSIISKKKRPRSRPDRNIRNS